MTTNKQQPSEDKLVPVISRRACLTYLQRTGEDSDPNSIVPQRETVAIRIPPGVSFHAKEDLARCGVGSKNAALDPFASSQGEIRQAALSLISEYEVKELVRMSNRYELKRWAEIATDDRTRAVINEALA